MSSDRLLRLLLPRLVVLGGVLAPTTAALAQGGPEAGTNELFFHGPKLSTSIDGRAPTSPTPQTQTATSLSDPEDANDDTAIRWSGSDLKLGALDKEMVLRWYFSSPNAAGVLIGVDADVRVLAIPATGEPRVIGSAEVPLVAGATPTLNESVVRVKGAVNDGERLQVQVVPIFVDTGQGLTAEYDATSTPSGFSFRDPKPTTPDPGVDGLASAPADGLAFSASVPADPQRDESEPNMEIDGDGNIYTCGPTGVSNGADYAQVSTDGGRQFHLLGEPPRGQQSEGGGGDCGLATSPERNAKGAFNYAFSGLGPLTNFVTAASDDTGQTLRSSPQSTSIPGVDRQWHTFVDADSVLLSYNQQAPRQVVVQRSDDGGVTYGPSRAATSTNPSFPGPMRSLPARLNPRGAAAGRVPYFSWNRDNQLFLAVSVDEGATWFNCKAQLAPGDPSLFTTVDNDEAGNIFLAYTENTKFHTYVTTLPIGQLGSCLKDEGKVDPIAGQQSQSTPVQAAFTPPVQVDRDRVRTSLFSWITAGGAPGRYAVAFYGSETDGDPNVGPARDDDGRLTGFRGSWDVYVSQTLDGLAAQPKVAQVKATTHPFHYDSICLNGLGCAVTGGDRSLADFFATDFSPTRHAVSVVYNQGYKRPDDAEGSIATPAVVSQIAGPTLDGKPIAEPQEPALGTGREDAGGDALDDYSRTCPLTTATCQRDGTRRNQPGADIRSVKVGPEVDPETGKEVANGGFTVTMKVADLSDEALQQALTDGRFTRLQYVFRWINGFRSAAAVASYDPVSGFTVGFNGFTTGSVSCGGTGSKCLTYPGSDEIPGEVDQATGTITLSVPREKLLALGGSTGPNQRPEAVDATAGSRFYDGTAFTLGQTVDTASEEQSFLYPFDNAPAFDFLTAGALPAAEKAADKPAEASTPATDGGAGTTPAQDGGPSVAEPPCTATAAFRSAAARPRGSRVALTFSRAGTRPVTVDVFRSSAGRRVLGERLVARFTGRRRSFVWDGQATRPGRTVGDGIYFARFRTRDRSGKVDVRRSVLERSGGRWSRRPAFHQRRACGLVRTFKLERPAFGGPSNRALLTSYRLTRDARVSVAVLRGGRVVRRFRGGARDADTTYRLRFDAEGRPRGDFQVRITATRGGRTTRRTLVSRRL